MQHIALPLRVGDGAGGTVQVAGSVDVAVDLGDAEARGIHMSRLYLRLQDALSVDALTFAGLRHVLQDCVDSQAGLSTRARLLLRFEQLLRRRALASAHSGWKAYTGEVEAVLDAGADARLEVVLAFSVDYSSTCPASAALSRQLNAERFAADFAAGPSPATATVADWLASPRGLAATPHAQRSRAEVRAWLVPPAAETGGEDLPVVAFIDAIESALATPVQTAVKREDEQAFTRLNAENLMFCEDAARRVAAALAVDPRVARFEAKVAHFESLHAHDAVARVSGAGAGAA